MESISPISPLKIVIFDLHNLVPIPEHNPVGAPLGFFRSRRVQYALHQKVQFLGTCRAFSGGCDYLDSGGKICAVSFRQTVFYQIRNGVRNRSICVTG